MTRPGVRVGCSGWQYTSWRGEVYPPGLAQRHWLTAYAERFEVVEVNSTFYRLPNRDAVARWVEQTPPGFTFVVKVSRYLTHYRRLEGVADGMERLLERIAPLVDAGRLGPLLWQLPARFTRDDERLAAALAELPPGLQYAWEFRDESWFVEPVYEQLRAYGIACVIADDARRPLPVPPPTAPFAFVRLHYGMRGRGGNYSATEIAGWADRLAGVGDGFCFLNNDWCAYAPRNASLLEREVARRRGGD